MVAALICAHEVRIPETSTLTHPQLPGGPSPVPVAPTIVSKSEPETP